MGMSEVWKREPQWVLNGCHRELWGAGQGVPEGRGMRGTWLGRAGQQQGWGTGRVRRPLQTQVTRTCSQNPATHSSASGDSWGQRGQGICPSGVTVWPRLSPVPGVSSLHPGSFSSFRSVSPVASPRHPGPTTHAEVMAR